MVYSRIINCSAKGCEPSHAEGIINRTRKLKIKNSEEQAALESTVKQILEDVQKKGPEAVIENGIKFDNLNPERIYNSSFHPDLFFKQNQLEKSYKSISVTARECLERVKQRITNFAKCQLNALSPVCCAESYGLMGHEILPVKCAGCYAPGGNFMQKLKEDFVYIYGFIYYLKRFYLLNVFRIF